ncbi:YhgE/Pip domain-containing protein [Paenibacillus mendelii]|uniref:YhgE/Pip domain-containing protein n=1 Tax=Paenibacillus mendelii TaxID=206163 RepID=A0ABV6JL14_9BACL|nr:ABC transporter permease [Paenibacillus mendelii]MCQ6562373.1 ABC transporter permease [Paenibacillus mendelii]
MGSMKALLKNKAVIGGIVMTIFYQFIMIGIFMYGYSAIPKNITETTIAIVNEDQQYGKEISKQLQEQLPFHITTESFLTEAEKQLENRDIQLLLHIPENFSELMQQGDTLQLDFTMNQSNPAMVTSSLQQVISQMTSKLNDQFSIQYAAGALKGLHVPDDQAQQIAEDIPSRIVANTVLTNPMPAGMHNQMAPMFLTMCSYVGAMIFSMLAVGAMGPLIKERGRWKAFVALQGVSILVSLVAPLVGLLIYFSVQGGYGAVAFVQMWLMHALEMLGAIEFTSIFVLLLGQGGMLLNLPLLLAQTISSGAVMSQEMMPGIFKFLSHISVMFYSVHLDYNLLFGGGGTGGYLLGLSLLTIIAMAIGAIIVQFKTRRTTGAEA